MNNRTLNVTKLILPWVCVPLLLGAGGKSSRQSDALKIVSDAEKVRSVEPAEVNVSLSTEAIVSGMKQITTYEMQMHRGIGKKAYVRFLAPSEEVGRQMLVVGDQYWARFPDSARVHRISRKEMIGNSVFQLVDLFQMDIDNDYNVQLAGSESIGGNDCYIIELKAKSDEAPYARVEYFIAKKDHFPIRAKFFSGSGKHLRTLETIGRKKYSGVERPAAFVMTDEVTKGRLSRWTTNQIKQTAISDNVFSKDFLLAH
jgi:outer membrane lipoprotein-sorting protein